MILKNGEVLLRWPLDQHVITQGWHYNSGASHNGIDLRTVIGNTSVRPVYAAADGVVAEVQQWDGHTRDERSMQSYGNRVDIRHADYKRQSLMSRYAHLFKYLVAAGQKVKEGQLIGYSGATGNVYGAHLHFEVLLGGKRTNPLVWLDDNFTTASASVYTYGPGEHAVQRPEEDKPAAAGMQIITAKGLTNMQALAVYLLAIKLQLVEMRLYAAVFADAACTRQDIEVGPVSSGDAQQVLDKLAEVGAKAEVAEAA